MRSPDEVFAQLAKLYDFYREISKFKFKGKQKPDKVASTDRESALLLLRR